MPIAVIGFDFDPLLRLTGDLVVRWQTLALAAVIAATLLVTGSMARRAGLRRDDLLFVIVGVVPGAVLFGRLGYGLIHLSYFQAHPLSIADPSVGGLELGFGVLGGLLSGGYVARLLGSTAGQWLHLAAVPSLVLLGAGKLTMVLGGVGQGAPSGDPWATAFLGDGPWGSIAPAIPSQPSQIYEGLLGLVLAGALAFLLSAGAFGRRDGRALFLGLGLWAIGRAVVALSWRDAPVAGPLPTGSILALIVAAVCLTALNVVTLVGRRARASGGSAGSAGAADAAGGPGGPGGSAGAGDSSGGTATWPDPAARPPF